MISEYIFNIALGFWFISIFIIQLIALKRIFEIRRYMKMKCKEFDSCDLIKGPECSDITFQIKCKSRLKK